jgi:hypothetical protein
MPPTRLDLIHTSAVTLYCNLVQERGECSAAGDEQHSPLRSVQRGPARPPGGHATETGRQARQARARGQR